MGLACQNNPLGVTGPSSSSPATSLSPILPIIERGQIGASGNQFTISGNPVQLRGAISCCFYPWNESEAGWPIANHYFIDLVAANGGNYIHIRPSFADVPFSTYDDLIYYAMLNGIVVEVDIRDLWAVRNGVDHWREGCDIVKEPPKDNVKRWIRDLVGVTGKYANVIYQLGNEAFVPPCDVSLEWELGLRDTVRAVEKDNHYLYHLIGSNAQIEGWEQYFDYTTWHGSDAKMPGNKPRLVNEVPDRDASPEQYKRALGAACRYGTSIALWRGEMDDKAWSTALATMKAGCSAQMVTH